MIGDENKFDGEKIRLDLVEPSLIEAIGKEGIGNIEKGYRSIDRFIHRGACRSNALDAASGSA